MARTSRRKKTSRKARRTSRKGRRRVAHRKGLVVYKTKRGKKWKLGRIPAGLKLRAWRKSHKGARVLGHAVSYKAQQKLIKRLLKKAGKRVARRRRSRR